MKPRLCPLFAFLAFLAHGLGGLAHADESPKALTKSIRFELGQPGTLESALSIRQASGAIELTRGVGNGQLVVDLYHKGKMVATEGTGLIVAPRAKPSRWEFVVQVIDLDILRLGDGKPGHSRIILTLKAASSASSTKRDIAKTTFPITSDNFGGSAFNTSASSPSSALLGLLILNVRPDVHGKKSMESAGSTIEDALKGNPNSDLAVIRFVAEEIKR